MTTNHVDGGPVMDDGETRGMVTCPCGWFKPQAYFRDLREHQDTHRQEQDRQERFAVITAAVAAIVPNVQNETAAWNTWNNLASSDDFRKAIVMIDRDRQWSAHEPSEQEPADG
jgi:hypothetical protein